MFLCNFQRCYNLTSVRWFDKFFRWMCNICNSWFYGKAIRCSHRWCCCARFVFMLYFMLTQNESNSKMLLFTLELWFVNFIMLYAVCITYQPHELRKRNVKKRKIKNISSLNYSTPKKNSKESTLFSKIFL